MPTKDYSLMKVSALKEALLEKGLSVIGKKNELIGRLINACVDEENSSVLEDSAAFAATLDNSNFSEMAASSDGVVIQPISENPAAIPLEFYNIPNDGVAQPMIAKVEIPAVAISLTEEEKMIARKAKFGIKTDEDKLLDRARRFCLYNPQLEEERKKARAIRFGISTTSDTSVFNGMKISEGEALRRKKRAERFGIVDEASKRQRRAERFGLKSEEEKMKLRLQRFSVAKV